MPREVVRRLNREIAQGLKTSELRDAIVNQGAEPVSNPAEQFARFIRDANARWARAIKAAGVKAEP